MQEQFNRIEQYLDAHQALAHQAKAN